MNRIARVIVLLSLSCLYLVGVGQENADQTMIKKRFAVIAAASVQSSEDGVVKSELRQTDSASFWFVSSQGASCGFTTEGQPMVFDAPQRGASVEPGLRLSAQEIWSRCESWLPQVMDNAAQLERLSIEFLDDIPAERAKGLGRARVTWVDKDAKGAGGQRLKIIVRADSAKVLTLSNTILFGYGPNSKTVSVQAGRVKAENYLEQAVLYDPAGRSAYEDLSARVHAEEPTTEWMRPQGGWGNTEAQQHLADRKLRLGYVWRTNRASIAVDTNTGELLQGMNLATFADGSHKPIPQASGPNRPRGSTSTFNPVYWVIGGLAIAGVLLFVRLRRPYGPGRW